MNPVESPVPVPVQRPTPEAAPGFKLGRLAWALLILILLLGFAGFVPRWHQHAALQLESRELAVPTVTVVSAAPGKVAPGLSFPAEVKAFVEAPIHARASGFLKRWLVDIGSQVEAGQLLAEIDTPELNQELAHSRAELNQAEAALVLAKTTAARWADLLKTVSVSQQENAEKEADLALKSATVEAARANVRRLEELQSFSRVTAPFAGTITARKTDVGELIAAASGKELFLLAQTGTLRVYVHVPQTAARSVRTGQSAELTLPELPGRIFPAKVVRTSGVMNSDSRTLLTELEVDNSQGDLMAGSYAQVRFTDIKIDSPLALPSNTLLFRAEGPQVGVVQPDGKVQLRQVVLGRDFGQTVEILSGVTPAERIILNPADSLVSGAKVRMAENSAAK